MEGRFLRGANISKPKIICSSALYKSGLLKTAYKLPPRQVAPSASLASTREKSRTTSEFRHLHFYFDTRHLSSAGDPRGEKEHIDESHQM